MSIIELYNKDCMEAMKEMPKKAFDLAIVDPPYGIGISLSNWQNYKNPREDYSDSPLTNLQKVV